MKKYSVLFALLLVLTLILPTSATELYAMPRVVDYANILTAAEKHALLTELDRISDTYDCDVVLYTLVSLDGKDITALADDTFDYNGYGQGEDHSGILFMISMCEREWAISTCGTAIDIFYDDRQADMMDAMLSDLRNADHADAFSTYAGCCEEYLIAGVPSDIPSYDDYAYDYDHDYSYDVGTEQLGFLEIFIISGVIGLVAAFIYTAILKGQLTSVAPAKSAANYTKAGSFNLTRSEEVFLYRNVTRHAKPQNNSSSGGRSSGRSSTHRSSSGRSHGGSRGKF